MLGVVDNIRDRIRITMSEDRLEAFLRYTSQGHTVVSWVDRRASKLIVGRVEVDTVQSQPQPWWV